MTVVAGDLPGIQTILDAITQVPGQAVVSLVAAAGGKLATVKVDQGVIDYEIDNTAGLTATQAQTTFGQCVTPLLTFAGCANRKFGSIQHQSNALGRDTAANATLVAPTPYAQPYSPVLMRQKTANSPTDPLVWSEYTTESLRPRTVDANGNAGCELELFRLLDEKMPNLWNGLKVAIGGSSLAERWAVAATYPTLPLGVSNLYEQWWSLVVECQTLFNAQLAFCMPFWGETDALDATMTANFQANALTFIDTTRSRLGYDVPFIMPRLSINMTDLTFRANIQTAVDNICGLRPACFKIFTDDPAIVIADGVHYTTNSQIIIARRALPLILNNLIC